MIKVLYFARLREAIGHDSEQIELPAGVTTVGGLRDWLCARGAPWSEELNADRRVLMAVNQDVADQDEGIVDGDEIAFFPPVTGG
jgi:molybdopterin synthase sulfur carrier subunit